MAEFHQLRVTPSSGGLLFECEQDCGRRLVVDRTGTLTVIDRGDEYALHRGNTGDIELAVSALSQP